jgi:uncharacterized protein with PQ loop repeat
MAHYYVLARDAIPLTVHEAFSGIFGSVSLACWIFLLLPQLYENYKAQSGDSISLAFLLVWFLGDITNLAGATWAKLVPTVIALAMYFCVMDLVLISQCLYYKYKSNKRIVAAEEERRGSEDSAQSEGEPLLARRESGASYSSIGLPGSHTRRRSSAASALKATRSNSLANIPEEYSSYVSGAGKEVMKNLGSIVFVLAAGTLGWVLAWQLRWWKPQPQPEDSADATSRMPLGAEILGYASAVCYLGARLPQIYKNYKENSCEGLSLLFFILSLMGNLTYGAGVCSDNTNLNVVLLMRIRSWLILSTSNIFSRIYLGLLARWALCLKTRPSLHNFACTETGRHQRSLRNSLVSIAQHYHILAYGK